jgi:hypothetical protein
MNELLAAQAEQQHKDRILTLTAAMLTGTTQPSDQIIDQVLMFASVIAKKIEAGVL